MSLFKLEGFQVIVDPEIKIILEFSKLIAEDKDRNKKLATKWFGYIYHMYDYKSPYQLYEEKERHIRVCKDVDLPGDFKSSQRMIAAISKYKELQNTPTVQTLLTTKQALISSEKAINALTQRIETLLAADEEEVDTVGEAVKNVNKLLDIAEKLPKITNVINDLEEKVKKEQSGESKLRGGGKKGMFED